jgi:hypothetical protein
MERLKIKTFLMETTVPVRLNAAVLKTFRLDLSTLPSSPEHASATIRFVSDADASVVVGYCAPTADWRKLWLGRRSPDGRFANVSIASLSTESSTAAAPSEMRSPKRTSAGTDEQQQQTTWWGPMNIFSVLANDLVDTEVTVDMIFARMHWMLGMSAASASAAARFEEWVRADPLARDTAVLRAIVREFGDVAMPWIRRSEHALLKRRCQMTTGGGSGDDEQAAIAHQCRQHLKQFDSLSWLRILLEVLKEEDGLLAQFPGLFSLRAGVFDHTRCSTQEVVHAAAWPILSSRLAADRDARPAFPTDARMMELRQALARCSEKSQEELVLVVRCQGRADEIALARRHQRPQCGGGGPATTSNNGRALKMEVADVEDLFRNGLAPPCVAQMHAQLRAQKHLKYQQRLDYSAALMDLGARPEQVMQHMASSWDTPDFQRQFSKLCVARRRQADDVDGAINHVRGCRTIVAGVRVKDGIRCPYAKPLPVVAMGGKEEVNEELLSAESFRCRQQCAGTLPLDSSERYRMHTSISGYGRRARAAADPSIAKDEPINLLAPSTGLASFEVVDCDLF